MNKIILLPLLLTASLIAQTFNVSTTPELRTALSDAATNGQDDTIILADGMYKTTDDGQGTFTYFSNEANALTLIGSNSNNVVVSGNNQHQIFNHKSTLNAPLKLEKLALRDGNTAELGAGVYASYNLTVIDCNISNNQSSSEGGGFAAAYQVTVMNTSFENNTAYKGGGFRSGKNTIILNSIFKNNTASIDGGGFYQFSGTTNISNTEFINNSARDGGGFVSPYVSNLKISNVKFENNIASFSGGGFYCFNGNGVLKLENSTFIGNQGNYSSAFSCSDSTVVNSLFKNNDAVSTIYISGNSKVINSIFSDNVGFDINGYQTSLLEISNNYINTNNINVSAIEANNIFDNVTLGFLDEANGNYRLTITSDLIDKGITTVQGVTMPTADLDGNARLAGGSIDIGPYEFSTTRPTINSITYTGIAKEFSGLTFNVDYTLTDGRTLESISYDYTNTDNWETTNVHTYNTAGTYTVNVKVTDSEGEFSITSKTVVIDTLPFSDMTDEQKLQKAIDPTYYDAIMAIIDGEKTSSYTSGYDSGEYDGMQYVQNNLTEFGLVTTSDCSTSVTDATNAGIATGKQYVLDNPSEFGLVTAASCTAAVNTATETGIITGKEAVIANPESFGIHVVTPLANTDINNLATGWSMVPIPSEITDMSIFDSAKIVWFYQANRWLAYSSNASTASALRAANIGMITTLPANSAIWVEK